MSRTNPPFRADHVGSLLRPPAIHEARAKYRAGALDAAELRAVEDREIEAMIPQLAATGIRSITDGEFRREWFHLDFLQQLSGITVEGMIAATSDSEQTVHQAPPRITVTDVRLDYFTAPDTRFTVQVRIDNPNARELAVELLLPLHRGVTPVVKAV